MMEIEDLLLGELSNALEDTKEPFQSSSISVECKRLKDLINNKKKDTGAAVDVIRRENLYYLNNIVAEWRLMLEKHSQYSPAAQIALNGQFNDRLKKIKKELEAHYEVAEQKDETSKDDKEKEDPKPPQKDELYPDQKPRWLRNPYHVERKKIFGIDDKSMAMERLLVRKETRNKNFQAIGIVGMTGVGKTTFCQVAFNNEEVKKHFLPRIWVEMSEQPEDKEEYKKEVVKSFLRSLGFEDKVITEIGSGNGGLRLLLLALRKQLQGKRYLVVLDDIWHLNENFKEFCSSLEDGGEEYKPSLSYGLPKGSCGCVIVTSRLETWATNMVGEKNLQRLTPLEDDKSIWEIFKQGIDDKGYWLGPDEEKIREEIVTRCAGLPLIAKMLGEIMIQKYVDAKGKGNGPLVA